MHNSEMTQPGLYICVITKQWKRFTKFRKIGGLNESTQIKTPSSKITKAT